MLSAALCLTSGNRDEVSKWTSWKAASTYSDLSINWMFVRSLTRGHGISTVCCSSCANYGQESSRIRYPSLIYLYGFRSTDCHSVIFLRMSVGALGDFVGRYLEYDEKNVIAYPNAYMRIRVMLDVCMPLQKERMVTLHGGREVTCRFRYERLHTFCFICGILGYKKQQCELRYRFPEDQLPFLWDASIKAISRQEARAQIANPWLRVRSRIEPRRNVGQDAQGQERG
ncbi:hypothetical protein LINGRAHAP2_LOCUS13810 [Linum grandiflorum]